MTSASGNTVRRERVVILHESQTLDDLDLWPNDRVLYGADFSYLGHMNSEGVFVVHMEMLN